MIAIEVRKNLDINQKTNKPNITIDNFLTAMQMDRRYANIRYNELSDRPEIHGILVDGQPTVKKWTDADNAASENYMEVTYGLYSPQKHEKALRLLFEERKYHPIRDLLDPVVWDGEERCVHFLHKWALVEDTDYTREVSRLIFAGGIHRLYNPGCKFDDVPILIGTKQGEGKSSLIHFLALKEDWYGEVTLIEGQQAIEQLSGRWICEISELLALTKTKEQEAAKAYMTREVDSYRKPWDRNVTELPRRCIFLGTTNSAAPLQDLTGNRRYYPVTVHCNGYDIRDNEEEIKAYALQCWAEARDKFRKGQMPNYADKRLVDVYREKQEEATQDDWRVGAITSYLEKFVPGTKICTIQIFKECLYPSSEVGPKPVESREIGNIMAKMTGWERVGKPFYAASYGRQRGWVKTASAPVTSDDDFPF